ncbi:probable G-protein coupled receptor B0563.6 [Haliotis cracherodii]|uniref:probable G-protein coupled receptor B0563.6 n=1 Tax=Haliotis cracherodii TaxID=6455 RepID=UPI0039E91BA3
MTTVPSFKPLSPPTDSVNTTHVTTGSEATLAGNEVDNVTKAPMETVDPYAIMNEGMVSKNQYEQCSFIINVIMKPTVCIAGVIMNVIGICVLLRKSFRRSTYIYLGFLSISDVGYLLCVLIRSLPKIIVLYDDVLANVIEIHIFSYISMYFDLVFTRTSVFLICTLSIERFVAVLRPLTVRELFLSRHALSICASVFAFCAIFYFHFLFVYYPQPYFNPSRNITMYTIGRRPWFFDSGFEKVFSVLNDILNLYVPPVILITCNIGILVKLGAAQKKRKRLFCNGSENEISAIDQKRITFTLLIISFFFLVVFLPVIVVGVLAKYDPQMKAFGREHYFLFLMADVTSLCWSMSSANDFIVYIYTSTQFRDTLLTMFCRGRYVSNMEPNQSQSSSNVSHGTTSSSDEVGAVVLVSESRY